MSKCIKIYAMVLAAAVLLSIGWATPLRGQAVANAQISGSVTDPSGAAVPGAKVAATQTNTGMVRAMVSGADGTYLFANLPVGPYTLQVETAGFQTYVQKGIILQVADSPVINVTLKVGQVTQEVVVSAGATMVQTQTTSVSQVVDERSVVDLPLNGRNPVQLAILAGAANNVAPANFTGSKEYPSAYELSVAGGQANGTNYLLDGGDNNDAFANVNLPFPFPDALQEFSVQTNSLPARYGVHPGAVVNMVTKSGTNLIHGDLFEFVRNGDADARNYFSATQDTLRRNQFGGTVGGPIEKDKLFGFFGYQGTRTRTAPASSIDFVPTAAMLSGDWSAFESAACQSNGKARTITNPATGQPYTGSQVGTGTYNQQALNLLKYIPLSTNPCGQLNYALPAPSGEGQYIGRMDYTVSSKHTLFGRYLLSDYTAPPQFGGDGLLTTQYGVLDRAQSTVLGDTYSISPTIVNSAHLTWSRLAIHRQADPKWISPTDLGVNMYSYLTNALYMTVGSDFSVGCSTCPASYFINNTGQFSDDVDILRGHHHISFGANVIRQQLNFEIGGKGDGIFTFSTQNTGDAMLDFMLGLPNSFTQAAPTVTNMRQLYIGGYASDIYQVTKRLSIQIGLRWEPYLSPRDIHNVSAAWFSQSAYDTDTTSKVFQNAPPGVFYTGDAGYPQDGRTFGKVTPPQPRVGIVWDPTGSGKQTIRAGYGLFYDMTMTFYYASGSSDAPWASQIVVNNPVGGFTNPYQGFTGGNPFPLPTPTKNVSFPALVTYAFVPANFAPQNTQVWDLSYENQITPNWLLSATFIGNKSTDISVGNNLNPAVYIPGTCGSGPCSTEANTQSRRVLSLINPTAGNMFTGITSPINANAEYSGLLLSAKHRFSQHYTLLANYTWSHCIDEGDFTGAPSATFQNTNDAFADRGNCGFDVRQIANLSFTATSPKFGDPWADRLLGNWQLAPLLALHSGPWFAPTMGGQDNSLTNNGLDRPNSVAGVSSYERDLTTRQWLNPAAFTANPTGTFGTAGLGSLVGPGYFDVDASLSRFFVVPRHENQRFELRFEFFNLFNHPNFAAPTSTETSSKFGQLISASDPRILEFAMKYRF